jgi:hypothetical protein
MKITEAIEICRLQEFWEQIITEYSISRPPRRRQELWIMLRSKLMVELLNIGEPVPMMLKRFQHLTRNIINAKQKKSLIAPMTEMPVHEIVEKKLEAISTIYYSFLKISDWS